MFEAHAAINCLQFSPFFDNILAAVCDDGQLIFLDTEKHQIVQRTLLGEILENFVGTSISFSGFYQIAAIGGEDGRVVVLDLNGLRLMKTLQFHKQGVYQVQFSPFYKNLLVTGCEDGRVCLWNIQKQNEPIFVHAGHTTFITDVRFHPQCPNLLVSSAEDNSLMFWWPSEVVFQP